jgi:Xaa-Pro dipeptidase
VGYTVPLSPPFSPLSDLCGRWPDSRNVETAQKDELSSLKYPAKSHARKVVTELAKTTPISVRQNGVIYLPGEPSRLFEDSDQGPKFRQRR